MSKKVSLGLSSAFFLVVGCVIGSGVFVKPGRVLLATQNSTDAILAWVFGGLLTIAAGLTVAEIATRIPKSGGVAVFMEELFGRPVGFTVGWVQSIIYGPALWAALGLYFATLLQPFLNYTDDLKNIIALVVVYFLCLMACFGTLISSWIQNIATITKLIPIFLVGVFGVVLGNETIFGVSVLPAANSTPTPASMGTAVLATLWAYDGWIQVANLTGQLKQPEKNLPRAIIFGLVFCTLVYVLINISLFHTVPVQQIAELGANAAAEASKIMFGPIGGSLIGIGILISIFGCLNGNIMTMAAVPHAMASRDLFPFAKTFSKSHAKTGAPIQSIALKLFVATLMMVFLDPDRITDIAMFSIYIFYGILFLGIFKVRKIFGKPAKGQYRVPLYPVIPLVAFFGTFWICSSMIKDRPMDAALSIGLSLFGTVVYFFRSIFNDRLRTRNNTH